MRNSEGFTDLLLLELMEEKPRYGYEIIKEIEEKSGEYWKPGQGTVYGALERLDEEGMIEEVEPENDRGNNNRNYYGLTETGKEELRDLRDQCEEEIKPEERVLGLMYIYRFIAGEKKFQVLLQEMKDEFFNKSSGG